MLEVKLVTLLDPTCTLTMQLLCSGRFGPCLNYIWCRNYKQNECRNDSIKLVMDNEDSHFLKMCL